MRKGFLTFICVLSVAAHCSAYAQQKERIMINAYIRDAFTRETLKDATVSIFSGDSVFLDTMRARQVIKRGNVFRHIAAVAPQNSYLLKAECKGYDTQWMHIRQIKADEPLEVLLHRSPIQLKEVTVKGSKILMVNRGDTIIYNASAFQLSNGSMLDALIKQLPGVELHPGGRITVNGKYVSSLLVNGRDFFRGDPKIALDNLPAYYVDKVKVYHKLSTMHRVMYGDTAKASQRDDPYVMDVQLKRDYAEGWLGNAEAGYGTHDRWMARLFGMRYTKHSGLFVYGNLNNLNNSEQADKHGGWAGKNSSEGLEKNRSFGINFDGDDKVTKMEYSTSAKVAVTDGDYEEKTSADNYFATGNTFYRSHTTSSNRSTEASWQGRWSYPKVSKFLLSLEASANYSENDNRSFMRSASFTGDPNDSYRGASIDSLYAPIGSARLSQMLINRYAQQALGRGDNFAATFTTSNRFRVGRRWLGLNASASYHNQHRKDYTLEDLLYGHSAALPDEFRNKYSRTPSRDYEYKLGANYTFIEQSAQQRNFELQMSYEYRQRYTSGERQLYRLDHYDDYRQIALLPSTTDSLQATVDLRNSYNTTTLAREHQLMLIAHLYKLQLTLPVGLRIERISDYRNSASKRLTKDRLFWNPSLTYLHKNFTASYRINTWMPDIYYLLNLRDDSDPLNIWLGNDELKYTWQHSLYFIYRKTQNKHQRRINASLSAALTQNAVSMGRSYDLATGVTTYRPDNINGNWNIGAELGFGQAIDHERHLMLSTTTSARYHHSVDYAAIGTTANERRTVNNYNIDETLKGEYRLNGWYVAATAHAGLTRLTSPSLHFKNVNAWDYNYGLKLTKQLVKNLDLDTEMMMWSRRGYSDPTMNSDELIWNASLAYAFGKLGQWVVKLEGRDMLRRQSSVRQTVNAQGRTETWYKTIPSYWMMHLIYQFKKTPKKR